MLPALLPGQSGSRRDTVAGIPINYEESEVGVYELPDLFTLNEGGVVKDADTWYMQRRPEILEAFKENQYGHDPGRPEKMLFDVFDEGTPAFDSTAIRKQLRVFFAGDTAGPFMDLLIYLPPDSEGPVPLLMSINFIPNSTFINDPGIRRGEMWSRDKKKIPAPEESFFGTFDVAPFIARGIGIACIYYGDIEPDFAEGIQYGIRATYLEEGQEQPKANEWGAIASWAWGLSRAMDYFETDSEVDAEKIAIFGISRLGKTVMWAGANDPRFALVIASCSGEGGAALSRRNYGETIAHLTAPGRYPYQFCANYQKFAKNVDSFPVDAHMLVALIAPRPLLLQTGISDSWSDPKGEFLAAKAANPVYELLGENGLGCDEMPEAGISLMNTLGYYMHEGGHGTLPSDYEIFIEFLEKQLISVTPR